MILVLSDKEDVHCQYTCEILRALNAEVFVLDTSQFPINFSVAMRFSGRRHAVYIGNHEKEIDGHEIVSVWNRRRPPTKLPEAFQSVVVREYIARESQIFLSSLHNVLGSFWVSEPDLTEKASRKPYQLLLARQMGFQVPETFIGNSFQVAKEFLDRHEDVALKAIGLGAVQIQSEMHPEYDCLRMYTKRLSRSSIEPALTQVQNCPIIIQPYVEKKFELRITVIGNSVFSCAIDSQASERTMEDWRKYDFLNTPHSIYELPAEVEGMCIELVRKLGLVFGCIDMIVTPKGEYVFLEINPNGQWLWIERLTGMPIGETLAKMLIAGKVV